MITMNDVDLNVQHDINADDVKSASDTNVITSNTTDEDENSNTIAERIRTSRSTNNIEKLHSLVAGKYKENDAFDLLQSKCFNNFYDCLIIIISILDVTTDILVLISYHNDNRMAFFTISFIIVAFAQFGYIIMFAFRVDINTKLSDQAKFAKNKIKKHRGLILKAVVESLPQSILQFIAMIYYQEQNWISTGSILLSLTSVVTKSFVFSRGVEWRSYIFCWLCVVTDFVSIFFLVSWLFLSHSQHINGDFLGYFGTIGEVWYYKVLIGILPLIVIQWIGCVLYGLWWCWNAMLNNIDCCEGVAWFLIFITIGNTLLLIGIAVMEICCFTFLTIFIYQWLTVNRWDFQDKYVSNIIKEIITFVSNSYKFDTTNNDTNHNNSNYYNDRIIRILCVNYSYLYNFETFYEESMRDKLPKEIKDERKSKHPRLGISMSHEEVSLEVDRRIDKFKDARLYTMINTHRHTGTLNKVTYKEIREHCYSTKDANIFEFGLKPFKLFKRDVVAEFALIVDYKDVLECIGRFFVGIFGLIVAYILVSCYVLSRIVTILYPYFILFYIYYNDIYYKLNVFQLTMLGIYIILQIAIFIFSYFVFRIHFWLWHILPGKSDVTKEIVWGINHDKTELNRFLTTTYKYYDQVQWLPLVSKILIDLFGSDIGNIVVDYLKEMNWEFH